MTEHSDDLKIAELLAPLRRIETVPLAGATRRGMRWLRNPVFAGAVVAVALILASVAIAAGFGAFKGISSAYGPQTRAALKWAKRFQAQCPKTPPLAGSSIQFPQCHLMLASARLLRPGSNVYVVTDSRGELCFSFAVGAIACGLPLDASRPISLGAANNGPIPPGGTLTVGGVALDGVKSVSFKIWNHPVSVRVRHNVWIYTRHHSTASGPRCIVVHMADGSTLKPYPEVPCPS